jgi:hypothetical protein
MGKYTHLRHKLEPFEKSGAAQGLAGWYEKVNAWTMDFLGVQSGEGANAARLAREYADRYNYKKALKAKISMLNIELEALSKLGVTSLENSGIEKINLSNGGYAAIKDTPYSSIEDRAVLMAWLKREKMEQLLTLNYQTLSAMNNQRLVAGKPVIPGTKIFMKTTLTVRGVEGANGDEE